MIKFVFRWGFRLLILVIVLVIGALLAKNQVAKSALEARLRQATGMDARISNVDIGLFSPTVTIEKCRIYNTAEFGGSPFLDIEELHVELDRSALFYRELDIKMIRFNLVELNFVQNQQGVYNLQAMQKHLQDRQGGKQSKEGNQKQRSDDDFKFLGIGLLNLSVGKVRDIDLRAPQRQREYPVNIQNATFRNLRTADDFMTNVAPVLMKYGVAAAFAQPVPTNTPPPSLRGTAPASAGR